VDWFELLDAIVIVSVVVVAANKYNSLLNPVTFKGAFCFVSYIIGTDIYQALGLLGVSKHVFDWSQILAALSFLTFGVAYIADFSPFERGIKLIRKWSSPFGSTIVIEKSALTIPILLCEFCVAFLLLAVSSGAGLLWVTNPREAYQLHRSGVGVWWALSSAALYLAYFVYLLRYGKNVKRVLTGALIFSAISYMLGSKGLVLGYFVFALVFIDYHLIRLSRRVVLSAGASLVIGFVGLQFLFGTAGSIIEAAKYFDYMPNTQQFLDSPNFSFQYGRITISSLWQYVPRVIYPSKPYAYGPASITEIMYPGAAEEGATPGLTGWIVPYTDFGIFGIVFFALLDAWVSKAAFELFIKERSLMSFALAAQIGFPYGIILFYNAPFPVFWPWLVFHGAIIYFLRIAGRTRNRLASGCRTALTTHPQSARTALPSAP
jgi:oligosaccharide repeat unit polymerase